MSISANGNCDFASDFQSYLAHWKNHDFWFVRDFRIFFQNGNQSLDVSSTKVQIRGRSGLFQTRKSCPVLRRLFLWITLQICKFEKIASNRSLKVASAHLLAVQKYSQTHLGPNQSPFGVRFVKSLDYLPTLEPQSRISWDGIWNKSCQYRSK